MDRSWKYKRPMTDQFFVSDDDVEGVLSSLNLDKQVKTQKNGRVTRKWGAIIVEPINH